MLGHIICLTAGAGCISPGCGTLSGPRGPQQKPHRRLTKSYLSRRTSRDNMICCDGDACAWIIVWTVIRRFPDSPPSRLRLRICHGVNRTVCVRLRTANFVVHRLSFTRSGPTSRRSASCLWSLTFKKIHFHKRSSVLLTLESHFVPKRSDIIKRAQKGP